MTEYKMNLSTTEPNNYIGIVKLRHGDVNSQAIVAQIVENGQPKSFEGLQPFFCLMAQEITGQGVSEEKVISFDASKGTLNYISSDNALQMVGRNEAYFSFRKQEGGRWIEQFSTRTFHYIVEKSIYSQPFKDSNYWWTFKELYRIFNQYIEDGKDSWEEFVNQNKEIIESVDPGGVLLTRLGIFSSFRGWDYSMLEKVKNEFEERGVNVKWFGAKSDGLSDNYESFSAAKEYIESLDFKLSLIIPPGEYILSKTIQFNKEITIRADEGAWINYTGEGSALILGPDGLDGSVYNNHTQYEVRGLGFIGGDNSHYGIKINKWITQPIIDKCLFKNYGNADLNVDNNPVSSAIFFDENVWYGIVQNCRFEADAQAGPLTFLSMAPYGNTRIVVRDSLVHSLSGVGTAIFLDGVNCICQNNKIEGFAINVMLGSHADYSIVDSCYFEKAGTEEGGCISIGSYRTTETRSPVGIIISDSYCNTHWQPSNPVSYFISPTKSTDLIVRLTVERNAVNAWHDSQSVSKMVSQNNLGGQTGNVANGNKWINIDDIVERGNNVARWSGTDSNYNLKVAKQNADITEYTMRKSGMTVTKGILDESYNNEYMEVYSTDGSRSIYEKGILICKMFSTGQISFFKSSALGKFDIGESVYMHTPILTKKYNQNTAPNGAIYEDETTGNLMYKNQAGAFKQLSN